MKRFVKDETTLVKKGSVILTIKEFKAYEEARRVYLAFTKIYSKDKIKDTSVSETTFNEAPTSIKEVS
jgi:hypothetical protein